MPRSLALLWRMQQLDWKACLPSAFARVARMVIEETLLNPCKRSVQGTFGSQQIALRAMVDVSKWSSQNDWENPAIYERNRARMHVPLRSYTTKDAALRYFTEGPKQASRDRTLSLNSSNGDWSFKLYDKPEDVQQGFWTSGFDDKGWNEVRNRRRLILAFFRGNVCECLYIVECKCSCGLITCKTHAQPKSCFKLGSPGRSVCVPSARFWRLSCCLIDAYWSNAYLWHPWRCPFSQTVELQIEVPGNWETQGHGIPIYTNFQYPWPITAPYVPEDNPTGCYRRWFDVPQEWEKSRSASDLMEESVFWLLYIVSVAPWNESDQEHISSFLSTHAIDYRTGKKNLRTL